MAGESSCEVNLPEPPRAGQVSILPGCFQPTDFLSKTVFSDAILNVHNITNFDF
jgi:hypothetical protein